MLRLRSCHLGATRPIVASQFVEGFLPTHFRPPPSLAWWSRKRPFFGGARYMAQTSAKVRWCPFFELQQASWLGQERCSACTTGGKPPIMHAVKHRSSLLMVTWQSYFCGQRYVVLSWLLGIASPFPSIGQEHHFLPLLKGLGQRQAVLAVHNFGVNE